MKQKPYIVVKIDLVYLKEKDVITASAGEFDTGIGNDVIEGGDDIFD